MEILTPLLIFLVIAKNCVMYKAQTFFIEKLRKFPFGTYIVLNKKHKNLQRKKHDR